MKHHLFCLTIDTDPDGLSGLSVNRRTLSWEGLILAQNFPGELEKSSAQFASLIPITWFIRIDGQLRDILGTSLYLLEKYENFWRKVENLGHELGWHPHLYRQPSLADEPLLITDSSEACEELERLWDDLKTHSFRPRVFRNGEGWHCPQTLDVVEKFGLICDSTAIPGRVGRSGHPQDWSGTLNQPYFPDPEDIRKPGSRRPLLEVPLNTWHFQTSYDIRPRLRYMNPAIHSILFDQALNDWEKLVRDIKQTFCVWVLIFHPDEIMIAEKPDLLYAHSSQTVIQNLVALIERVRRAGHTFEFTTLSDAATRWKQVQEQKSKQ